MLAPAPASSLVGRTTELADLAALVGRERLVTVVGPGGCGKTRLTIEAVRGRFPGLQQGHPAATQPEEGAPAATLHGFVELAAAGPATDLARAVLNACGLPEGVDPVTELGAGLLVLDNCEHLHREVAALADALLRGNPELRILATSQVTLGVAGEVVLPLVGRFPTEVALALTDDRAALETLVDHSLVQFDAAEGRYLLLDTIREYAGRLLAASGEGVAAHRRLLDWAVGFAKEVRDGLERAAPDVLRRVDAADAAITSALAWPVVAGQGRTEAAAVAVDIAFAWSLRGRCAEGLAHARLPRPRRRQGPSPRTLRRPVVRLADAVAAAR